MTDAPTLRALATQAETEALAAMAVEMEARGDGE